MIMNRMRNIHTAMLMQPYSPSTAVTQMVTASYVVPQSSLVIFQEELAKAKQISQITQMTKTKPVTPPKVASVKTILVGRNKCE